MWGSALADHGIITGNGGFEVKIVEMIKFEDKEAQVNGNDLTSIGRFGWTVQDTVLFRV